MKPVLVLYATVDGQSLKVAQHAADHMRAKGLSVRLRSVHELNGRFLLGDYRAALLIAPVHASFHPREMLRFLKEQHEELEKLPVCFLSLSLSQAGVELPTATPAQRERSTADVAHLTALLCNATGLAPSKVVPIAGCLAYTRYGFVKRLMMRHIAKKAGGSTDTSRDHEYTDYARVDAAVDQLCECVSSSAGHVEAARTL